MFSKILVPVDLAHAGRLDRALAVAAAEEINRLILKAVADTGADLVVMASHSPRMIDWLLPSHGGHVAEHAAVSIFVVR